MKTLNENQGNYFTGHVIIKLIDRDGKTIYISSNNQVLNVGRQQLAHVAGGDITIPSTQYFINTLKISNGAVPNGGNPLNPTVPTAQDTGLFQTNSAQIVSVTLLPTFNAVSNLTTPVMTYSTVLSSSSVNMAVNEIGLSFGATGPIYAHYSFSTLDLTSQSNNSLSVTWTINF